MLSLDCLSILLLYFRGLGYYMPCISRSLDNDILHLTVYHDTRNNEQYCGVSLILKPHQEQILPVGNLPLFLHTSS
jgi:hypothetical protein